MYRTVRNIPYAGTKWSIQPWRMRLWSILKVQRRRLEIALLPRQRSNQPMSIQQWHKHRFHIAVYHLQWRWRLLSFGRPSKQKGEWETLSISRLWNTKRSRLHICIAQLLLFSNRMDRQAKSEKASTHNLLGVLKKADVLKNSPKFHCYNFR